MDFATWLAIRETYDHAVRHAPFVEQLRAALPATAPRVLDIATGRGSNLRYLRPRLPADTQWTVLDNDPALLALVGEDCTKVQHDLRQGLDGLPEADALVCSALLDLVDHGFLVAVRDHVVRNRLPTLITLTVDGRLVWEHPDPDDARVHAWYRLHQLTDRGFGPSVGTTAVDVLAALLEEAGVAVQTAEADWELPVSDAALIAAMRDGIARSAAEMSDEPEVVAAWRDRREALGGGLRVGHTDILALP